MLYVCYEVVGGLVMSKNGKRDMKRFFVNMLVAGDLLESFLDKFVEEYEDGLSENEKRELFDLVCEYKPESAVESGVIGMVKYYIECAGW